MTFASFTLPSSSDDQPQEEDFRSPEKFNHLLAQVATLCQNGRSQPLAHCTPVELEETLRRLSPAQLQTMSRHLTTPCGQNRIIGYLCGVATL